MVLEHAHINAFSHRKWVKGLACETKQEDSLNRPTFLDVKLCI